MIASLAYVVTPAIDAPELRWAGLLLLLPATAVLLAGGCAMARVRSKLAGWTTVLLLLASFIITLMLYGQVQHPVTVELFDWIDFTWGDGSKFHGFSANFSLYVDSLTLFWMLFVTGLGTLIALYATEYMEVDVGQGYTRFFAGVSIFLLAMSILVMAGNLLMLYLGWEGVGLASYLLIGYYYTRPSAVAAAKKAFIVNRIGDLGLALALFLIWDNYGTLDFDGLFQALAHQPTTWPDWDVAAIPYLIMLGAFGKSAQIPLYIWLPDAMEGPTPVSALIHAATMVTAGVYLIARTMPLFALHEMALPTVAWVGGSTALLGATIAVAQYDIKRIFAYSTISQLGYMFLGLGVGTSFGACYHVFTHAFFKALLFLTAGAVMHGFAGQLDLRKLSGIRRIPGFGLISWTMLVGCLWLSAFPYTAAFFSKDEILAQCFIGHGPGFEFLGWMGLATALLTAYYTFRVWFRVCAGPVHFEPGTEDHQADAHSDQHEIVHTAHGHSPVAGATSHAFHPHGPRWAMSSVLLILAIGAVGAGIPGYMALSGKPNWVSQMVAHSSAVDAAGVTQSHDHPTLIGFDVHTGLTIVGSCAAIGGILLAWYLHLHRRKSADALRLALMSHPITRWVTIAAENKWYVDEVYHAIFRLPLWAGAHILAFGDHHFLDGVLVDGLAKLPAAAGRVFRPLYGGVMQGYSISMLGGIGLILAWFVWVWTSRG